MSLIDSNMQVNAARLANKFNFIIEGGETERYHTVRTLYKETVGQHSFEVALYCYLMVEKPSVNLILAALMHDLAEHQTGDAPSNAKRKYNLRSQYKAIEAGIMQDIGLVVPLTEAEERILKVADYIQGMSFCVREMQMGNRKMKVIFDRYSSYFDEYHLDGNAEVLYNEVMASYLDLHEKWI